MRKNSPNYTATCIVEHQIVDPATQEASWQVHETMDIAEHTLDGLMEKAYGYIGRPERMENVLAVRLTGTAVLIQREQSQYFDHKNTVSLQLHILRERSTARYHDNDNLVMLPTSREKQKEHERNKMQAYA